MTRHRKSRKPGNAPVSSSKVETSKPKAPVAHAKKPKNVTGNKAGTRQQVAVSKKREQADQSVKDPRLGSKKAIVLVKPSVAQISAQKATKAQPMPAVKRIDPQVALMQEFEQIGEDERLLEILAKQEQELALTAADVDYFNEKMDRHQQLQALLGLADELVEEPADGKKSARSAQDLWDQFDNDEDSEH